MAVSLTAALAPPPRRKLGFAALTTVSAELKLTPSRTRVLAIAADGTVRSAQKLAAEAGVSEGVVRALAAAGGLASVPLGPDRRCLAAAPSAASADPLAGVGWLQGAQRTVAADLVGRVRRGGFGVVLLDGVTGSGKTDTYFAAIAATLEQGRQVLVLLPEIALGVEWQTRFEARFGYRPAEWHSDLTGAERRDTRRSVAEGEAGVVVGARSALFLPFTDLGLVIVDEEHDASFKQEDGVAYHARDMAIVRASLNRIPAILVSATPSLETVVNVEQHRYTRLALPERHGGAVPPEIESIDLRRFPPPRQRFLSPVLVDAVRRTLEAGEQALLFLNRRGYAPLTLCRTCGHRMSCPNCTAWLVEHRLQGRLLCHHCGHSEQLPMVCPACETPHSFAPCGPGVERLAEEVAVLFAGARVGVMASDLLPGPRAAAALLAEIERRVSTW